MKKVAFLPKYFGVHHIERNFSGAKPIKRKNQGPHSQNIFLRNLLMGEIS
jgi:hypothetical protein